MSRAHDFLQFAWKEPSTPNGRVTHYLVQVIEIDALYHVPEHCDKLPDKFRLNTSTVQTEFLIDAIKPFTLYELSVRAVNGAGAGQDIKITDHTQPYGEQLRPLPDLWLITANKSFLLQSLLLQLHLKSSTLSVPLTPKRTTDLSSCRGSIRAMSLVVSNTSSGF